MFPTIQFLPKYHKRFLSGYPWIYANEIIQSNTTKTLVPGELVQIEHHSKRVATGYFNRHSLIAFRLLSFDPTEAIDTAFFVRRLKVALLLRETFFDKPYYRLIYAEADGLPGLIIDRFDDCFVIQINTQGMEQLKPFLIEALEEVFKPTTLYFMNDSAVRQLEKLAIAEPEIIGKALPSLTVIENDTTFSIDMTSSQKTGWFYDHRENRKLIASLAKGKTVLDYFCYSGGFAIEAAKAGAKRVVGVDRSEAALENARASAKQNGVFERTQFAAQETFKDMDLRLSNSERFDIVVLDPPAFVKSKKDINVGLKGYEKLISKAIPLVAKNGLLLIASCSYHVKELDLKHCLIRALNKTHRKGVILKSLSAGFDHPLHPCLEESSYLKGFLVSLE